MVEVEPMAFFSAFGLLSDFDFRILEF